MKKITIYLICCLIMLLPACNTSNHVPIDGMWYCEELKLQLSFENVYDSFLIVDGKKIPCSYSNEHGTGIIDVSFLDDSFHAFDYDQIFFTGRCDYWDEEKMIVTEWLDTEGNKKGNQYTFVRVDKPQDEK